MNYQEVIAYLDTMVNCCVLVSYNKLDSQLVFLIRFMDFSGSYMKSYNIMDKKIRIVINCF